MYVFLIDFKKLVLGSVLQNQDKDPGNLLSFNLKIHDNRVSV